MVEHVFPTNYTILSGILSVLYDGYSTCRTHWFVLYPIQMVSAVRIMDYSRLEPEASLETLPPHQKPPPSWPNEGGLELYEVSFRYSRDLPLVLKSLSFSVNPSEKVCLSGIIGSLMTIPYCSVLFIRAKRSWKYNYAT